MKRHLGLRKILPVLIAMFVLPFALMAEDVEAVPTSLALSASSSSLSDLIALDKALIVYKSKGGDVTNVTNVTVTIDSTTYSGYYAAYSAVLAALSSKKTALPAGAKTITGDTVWYLTSDATLAGNVTVTGGTLVIIGEGKTLYYTKDYQIKVNGSEAALIIQGASDTSRLVSDAGCEFGVDWDDHTIPTVINNKTVKITPPTVSRADDFPNAIHQTVGKLYFEYADFTNCAALANGTSTTSGFLYMASNENNSIYASDLNVYNNSARGCGGVYLNVKEGSVSPSYFYNCKFEKNLSYADINNGGGGAIRAFCSSDTYFRECTFCNNFCWKSISQSGIDGGGAIRISGGGNDTIKGHIIQCH